MTALDELRSLITQYVSGDDIGGPEDDILCEVKHIADRIKEENRILQAERDAAAQTATDQAEARRKLQYIIEEEYMELPKDADGKVIHVGDMVDLKYGSDETVEVYGVNDHAVYTQYGCHGAAIAKLVKPKPETIDDVRNEITKDWDYAHDLIDRAYECGKRDA